MTLKTSTEHLAALSLAGFAFVHAKEFGELLVSQLVNGRPSLTLPPATREGAGDATDFEQATKSYSLSPGGGGGLGRADPVSAAEQTNRWDSFVGSWNHLGLDTYMADGGRYRRRRFGAFAASANEIARKPHQPHYQSRDYNTLNGGIERWFEPLTETFTSHPTLLATLQLCCSIFNALTKSAPPVWHTEVHQFRIEARAGEAAQPTPEGLHRDGVDWVLVLLIARENIAEGVTTIYDLAKQPLGSFKLVAPLDAALVDDSRVYHGVTAVQPNDPSRPAFRDVLVVTFRRP